MVGIFVPLSKFQSSTEAAEGGRVRDGSLYSVLPQDSRFCAVLRNCGVNALAVNRKPFVAG